MKINDVRKLYIENFARILLNMEGLNAILLGISFPTAIATAQAPVQGILHKGLNVHS